MQKKRLLASVVLLAVSGACVVMAQETIPQGPHGAATEEFQQKMLDKLMGEKGLSLEAPEGVDPVFWNAMIPEDNKPSADRLALGRKLYFDPRLSKDGTVSCSTCHDVTRAFSDQLPVAEGIHEQMGRRSSPTVMNITPLHSMFWDGRSPTIEHQARQPIINPIEMGMPEKEDEIISKIKNDPEYIALFKKAYNAEVNYQDIGRALAVFERTLNFLDSPFLRYVRGDENAMTAEAKAGWHLFNGKARCVTCHTLSPSNLTGSDSKFHNIGVSAKTQDFNKLALMALHALEEDSSDSKLDDLALNTDMSELGRFMVTRQKSEIGAFRTPILMNIGITGPYMHDGSLVTLWDVVDHYNKGGVPNKYLDGGIEPLNLSSTEIDQLVEFLFSLTDVRFSLQNKKFYEAQKTSALKARPERQTNVSSRSTLPFELLVKEQKEELKAPNATSNNHTNIPTDLKGE